MAEKPKITIDELLPPCQVADRLGLTRERFFKELKAQLRANTTKAFMDKFGDWQYSDPLVDWGTRQKATEMLGRVHGVFQDKLEVKGSIDITERILEARKRAGISEDPDFI